MASMWTSPLGLPAPLPTDQASFDAHMAEAHSMQQRGLSVACAPIQGDPLRQIEGAYMRIVGLRTEERLLRRTPGDHSVALGLIRSTIEQTLGFAETLKRLVTPVLPWKIHLARPDKTKAPSSAPSPLPLPLTVNLTSRARHATIRLKSVPEYLPLTLVVRVAPEEEYSGVVLPRSGQVHYSIEVFQLDPSDVTITLTPPARSEEGRGERSRGTGRRPDDGMAIERVVKKEPKE